MPMVGAVAIIGNQGCVEHNGNRIAEVDKQKLKEHLTQEKKLKILVHCLPHPTLSHSGKKMFN